MASLLRAERRFRKRTAPVSYLDAAIAAGACLRVGRSLIRPDAIIFRYRYR